MTTEANKRSARHPQSVLNEYLEQLLAEVPEPEAEEELTPESMARVSELPRPTSAGRAHTEVVETSLPEVATKPAPPATLPMDEAEPEVPAIIPVDIPVAPPPQAPPPLARVEPQTVALAQSAPANPIPSWAQEPFQALLFEVAGLTLAVPLVELSGILEWNSEITEMPGRSPWFLGLLAERGEQIKVVDPAVVVVPAKFRPAGYVDEIEKIILVGDSKWGLACRSVSEVINLTPDAVRWRSDKGTRPWLAGTVIQHMCALLDVGRFVELLRSERIEEAR